jgi:exosortase E/protease (VPEID-CTERM system)
MIGAYSHSPIAELPAVQVAPRRRTEPRGFGLSQRLLAVAVLLGIEIFSIDFARLQIAYRTSFMHVSVLGGNGKFAMHALLAFIALLLMFGFHRAKAVYEQLSSEFTQNPVRWGVLALHFSAMAGCLVLFGALFAGKPDFLQGNVLTARWALGAAGLCLAGLSFVPFHIWLSLLRSGGAAWAYASGGLLVMWQITRWSALIWKPATSLTFGLVKSLLHSAVPDLIADPVASTLSSHNFAVTISQQCSGIEGLGMIVVFSSSWLWLFRRECRFPRALLLIPAGISILWVLNVLRIATLFLIGNAGAPNVAFGGFHSQAGWITFNAVALGVSLAAQRVPWFRTAAGGSAIDVSSGENPTAAYLMPFAAILAAAMISRAASGTFEWLYPLRFFAAAVALWYFWPPYTKLNWGFGWVAPVTGAVVFALWIGLDKFLGHTENGIQAGLATLPVLGRMTWLTFRTLGAVLTVPIAEELAFRGFLIRRVLSADFEAIETRTFTYSAVLVSSITFGLLHGDRWLAGIVAGILYSGAYLWRGRIGDAVVAHAVTNALIAGSVLLGGAWYLW